MNIESPHDIQPEENIPNTKRHEYVRLTDEEANMLAGKSEEERNSWIDLHMPTSEILARYLESENVTGPLTSMARAGDFTDFRSMYATPKVVLHTALKKLHRHDIARLVADGVFDDSPRESELWSQRQTGEIREILDAMTKKT